MQRHARTNGRSGAVTLMPYIFKTADDGQRVAAEFGRLQVPENRHDPGSALIELAFVRLAGTGGQPGPPLVFLAGGPGGSGIESARLPHRFPWFMALRQAGDVILLDQRGVGLSNPRLDTPVRWEWPLDRPIDRASYLDACRDLSRRSAAFWRERGVDLAGYTTEESADDIDALRDALGVEKVGLWGASYGSHLALSTIRRHGERIHRAVIAMVEGPDHTIKLPSNIQRQLHAIDERVRADSALSEHVPDLLALMRSVIDRLVETPVTVEVADPATQQPVSVVVSAFDLKKVTASGLGDIEAIRRLPERYLAMSRGDFSWLGGVVLEWRRGWFGNAMAFHMDCASGASPERLRRIEEEARETLLDDLIDLPFPWIADAWGAPDLGEGFRAPVRSDVPALFISGTLDGRTPVSNAEEVAAGFAHGHHLIVDGMAHGVPDTPEIMGAMVDFLRGHPPAIERVSVPFAFAPVVA